MKQVRSKKDKEMHIYIFYQKEKKKYSKPHLEKIYVERFFLSYLVSNSFFIFFFFVHLSKFHTKERTIRIN